MRIAFQGLKIMVNRQLEMIYILMKKDSVTAEELAAHFEVSTRTVYRDIDSLSMAGIPVYASRGKGGGIRLMERFVLDKRLLTREEQSRILAAMASLRVTGAFQDEQILEKLETFFHTESQDWVSIDFSDWSGRRGKLFGQMKEAILSRRVMRFDYYGQYGDMTCREVEPVQLLFKEYTWYMRAYCRVRGAMRLFKVLRMKRVEILEEAFALGERHREERSGIGKETEETSGESEETEETEEGTETPSMVVTKVKAIDVVNIRTSDSETADKLGKAAVGDEFTLLEEKGNGWSKVEYDGGEAFIKSEFLEASETEVASADGEEESEPENEPEPEEDNSSNTPAASATSTVTVKENVRIRSRASETSDKLATAYTGEKLNVIMKQADGWTKIDYNGRTAYVKSEFVE